MLEKLRLRIADEIEPIEVEITLRNIKTGATVTRIKTYSAATIRAAREAARRRPKGGTGLHDLLTLAGISE